MQGGAVLDRVSSINDLGVIMDESCGRHGCKGLCDSRFYQEAASCVMFFSMF
jgi:hypothetical protein